MEPTTSEGHTRARRRLSPTPSCQAGRAACRGGALDPLGRSAAGEHGADPAGVARPGAGRRCVATRRRTTTPSPATRGASPTAAHVATPQRPRRSARPCRDAVVETTPRPGPTSHRCCRNRPEPPGNHRGRRAGRSSSRRSRRCRRGSAASRGRRTGTGTSRRETAAGPASAHTTGRCGRGRCVRRRDRAPHAQPDRARRRPGCGRRRGCGATQRSCRHRSRRGRGRRRAPGGSSQQCRRVRRAGQRSRMALAGAPARTTPWRRGRDAAADDLLTIARRPQGSAAAVSVPSAGGVT